MKKERIWKYFKVGDLVRNEEVWGNRLFIIDSFHGNWYLPLISVHPFGKENTVGNMCIFPVSETKLISSTKRPLRKLNKMTIIKLMKKGNVEAKREFLIRIRK